MTYLNSGDWVESLTALEYKDEEWKIFNFNTDYLQLNSNIAKATDAGGTVFVSAPTSTVIGSSSSAASGKENINDPVKILDFCEYEEMAYYDECLGKNTSPSKIIDLETKTIIRI